VRVLDPACGSGNFLYVALELLHELEKDVLLLHAKANRNQLTLNTRVGPHMLKGIEINPYAHELAQVTIWIGHLQWFLKSGFLMPKDPVLKPIEAIDARQGQRPLIDPAKLLPCKYVFPNAIL